MRDHDMEWVLVARCRSVDPELFFPLSRHDPAHDVAVEHCVECPVMVACGEYADASGQRHGVWGGRLRTDRQAECRHAEYMRRVARDPTYRAELAKRQAAYRAASRARSSVDQPTTRQLDSPA